MVAIEDYLSKDKNEHNLSRLKMKIHFLNLFFWIFRRAGQIITWIENQGKGGCLVFCAVCLPVQ